MKSAVQDKLVILNKTFKSANVLDWKEVSQQLAVVLARSQHLILS